MLQKNKYYRWMSDWVNTVNKNYIKEKQRRLAAFSAISCYLEN